MQPELEIKSKPIDFEICKRLGSGAADFLVLCFDGVQLEGFGTPYDTPENRAMQERLVTALNDRSAESRWPEMWRNWKPTICRQFGLPDTTTSADYRPVVSYKISRVCHGYSEHLHAAIGLFEKLADKIQTWFVAKNETGCQVEIIAKNGATISQTGERMSLAIAEAVLELLNANQVNDPAHRAPDKKL